ELSVLCVRVGTPAGGSPGPARRLLRRERVQVAEPRAVVDGHLRALEPEARAQGRTRTVQQPLARLPHPAFARLDPIGPGLHDLTLGDGLAATGDLGRVPQQEETAHRREAPARGKTGMSARSNAAPAPGSPRAARVAPQRRAPAANSVRGRSSSAPAAAFAAPSWSRARAPRRLPFTRCWKPTAIWMSPWSASRSRPTARNQHGSSSSCTSK